MQRETAEKRLPRLARRKEFREMAKQRDIINNQNLYQACYNKPRTVMEDKSSKSVTKSTVSNNTMELVIEAKKVPLSTDLDSHSTAAKRSSPSENNTDHDKTPVSEISGSENDIMALLKSLIYHHKMIDLLLNNNHTDQIKNDVSWIRENFDETYYNILARMRPKSFQMKKIKTWLEFKTEFDLELDFLNGAPKLEAPKKSTSIEASNNDEKREKMIKNSTKSDKISDEKSRADLDSESTEKAWASLPERPRRACTFKRRSTFAINYEPIKKSKSNKNYDKQSNNKKIEQLVVNCDPFNCLPSTSSSSKNQKSSLKTPQSININAPNLQLLEGKILLSNEPSKTNIIDRVAATNQSIIHPIITSTLQQPGSTSRIFHLQPCPSQQIINPIQANIVRPMTSQPLKGRVLLINSVPFLVQNGNQIQLPMIPTNNVRPIHPMPLTLPTSPNTVQISRKDEKKKSNSLICPEVIKIEDDLDTECTLLQHKDPKGSELKTSSSKLPIAAMTFPSQPSSSLKNKVLVEIPGNNSLFHSPTTTNVKSTNGSVGNLMVGPKNPIQTGTIINRCNTVGNQSKSSCKKPCNINEESDQSKSSPTQVSLGNKNKNIRIVRFVAENDKDDINNNIKTNLATYSILNRELRK